MLYFYAAIAIANAMTCSFWLYILIRHWNNKAALKKWVG